MKYKYFYTKQIILYNLVEEMEYFVNDYNNIRPHYSHHYKTPSEIHNNITIIDYDETLKQAVKDRVVSNREQICDLNCHSL